MIYQEKTSIERSRQSNFAVVRREDDSKSELWSGYLRKEATVISNVLPFVYHGFAHFTVHLKNSSFFFDANSLERQYS